MESVGDKNGSPELDIWTIAEIESAGEDAKKAIEQEALELYSKRAALTEDYSAGLLTDHEYKYLLIEANLDLLAIQNQLFKLIYNI